MSFLDMLPKSNADRKQNTNEKKITPPKPEKAEMSKQTEKDNDTSSKKNQ